MRHISLFIISCFSLSLIACGASSGSSSSKSSYEELKDLSTNLKKNVDDLTMPLTQVNSICDKLAKLPEELKLSPEQFKEVIVSAFGGEIKMPEGSTDDVKKKLTAFTADLISFKENLMATPSKILNLTPELAKALIKAPLLQAKIKVESKATQLNPFAKKAEKKKAKAQEDGADKLGAQVIADVKGIQTTVTTLPAQATAATAKFVAALQKAGIDNIDSLGAGAKDAGTDKVKATAKDVAK